MRYLKDFKIVNEFDNLKIGETIENEIMIKKFLGYIVFNTELKVNRLLDRNFMFDFKDKYYTWKNLDKLINKLEKANIKKNTVIIQAFFKTTFK